MRSKQTARRLDRVLISILTLQMASACSVPARNCALPPAGFHRSSSKVILRDFRGVALPDVVAVTVRANGRLAFNEVPASIEQIDGYIGTAAQMLPQPFVTVDFDKGANCATIRHVGETIARHFSCTTDNRCLQGPRPEWATR